MVIYEEEFTRLTAILDRLSSEAMARAVFLVGKDGQFIAGVGDVDSIDTTSLASLTAGSIAAAGGLAQLIGEKEFSVFFHEGEREHLHISLVAGQVILVVLFDERSSLGLVRLRVKKGTEELSQLMADLARKSEGQKGDDAGGHPLDTITEDDIDNLFRQ